MREMVKVLMFLWSGACGLWVIWPVVFGGAGGGLRGGVGGACCSFPLLMIVLVPWAAGMLGLGMIYLVSKPTPEPTKPPDVMPTEDKDVPLTPPTTEDIVVHWVFRYFDVIATILLCLMVLGFLLYEGYCQRWWIFSGIPR